MYEYEVTVAPDAEPVTLAQVKRLLRIADSETYDDADISDMISAAREWMEKKTGRSLVTQTVRMISTILDEMTSAPISGLIGNGATLALEIRPGPVQSVATVEIETQTNQWHTLTVDTDYRIDTPSKDGPAYVYLATWVLSYWIGTYTGIGVFPVEQRGPRLRVTYEAGYGDEGPNVPYHLREAIKRAAAFLYENRSEPIPDSLLPTEYIPWRL